jgi:site-specific DNA-methyltransferase (adenine-specific)
MERKKRIRKIESPIVPPLRELSNKIYQGDCSEMFAKIPDESVDLILTDPPYKDYQSNRPVAHQKVKKISIDTFDLDMFISESERVLKPGCHFYCWCDHLSFPAIFEAIQKRREGLKARQANLRFKYKNCLIWVKNNHGAGDLMGNYAPQHELVIYACKGKARPLRGKRPSNVFFQRDNQGSIQFFRKVSNYKYNHGTSKPPEILLKMIESSSRKGELVFDPYGGSMSTADAAMRVGRRFLMAELEADHCATGHQRLLDLREELLGEGYAADLLNDIELNYLENQVVPEETTSDNCDTSSSPQISYEEPKAASGKWDEDDIPDLLKV